MALGFIPGKGPELGKSSLLTERSCGGLAGAACYYQSRGLGRYRRKRLPVISFQLSWIFVFIAAYNPIGFSYGILSFAFLNLTFNGECRAASCNEVVFAVAHCLPGTPRAALKGVGVSKGLGKALD